MKGKFKVYKLFVGLAVLLAAVFCSIATTNTNNYVFAQAQTWTDKNNQEFSMLADGNVILSIEKVGVDVASNYSTGEKIFYGRDDVEFKFNDIAENGKPKQVVEDGQFVMLNNKKVGNQFVNEKTGYSEAIMISFGQYVYKDGAAVMPSASTNSNPKDENYAQISRIENITFLRNGNPIEDVTIRDTVSNTTTYFYDFMYLIPETEEGVEGHYEIQFKYVKNATYYEASFDFFLVCKTSYTKTSTVEGSNQTYSAAPNLGWVGAQANNEYGIGNVDRDGYVVYKEGIDGINKAEGPSDSVNTISYPSITYDYTKYKMNYKFISSSSVVNYDLHYQTKDNGEVELIVTATGGIEDEKPYIMANYDKTGVNPNLVTVVFTEEGDYTFSFKYLYTAGDIANAPAGEDDDIATMDSLKIEDKKLKIYGVDLSYSKDGYTGAEFRKFKFSTNRDAKVNLVVPNGVNVNKEDISKYKNGALDLIYTVDNTNYSTSGETKIRVGQIILSGEEDRTEDTLQNNKFSALIDSTEDERNELNEAIEYAATSLIEESNYDQKVKDGKNYYEFKSFDLASLKIDYIKSNQGSMWVNHNNKILEAVTNEDLSNSFYIYSKDEITNTSIKTEKYDAAGNSLGVTSNVLPYTNQVSFNKVGYYLIFLKVKPTDTIEYYQVYAFQYASSTVDINVKTDETTPVEVGAGKYTTKDVVVSWAKTATFESEIKGYYYYIDNYNATRDELLETQALPLTTNEGFKLLGVDGSFRKYLIKLERAGKSATYKIFTIDRQAISGVDAYVVETRTAGNSIYYAIDVDNKTNEPKRIENGITDSLATIMYNPKGSGAKITTKYYYAPIVVDSSIKPNGLINNKWLQTSYKLGTVLSGFTLKEVESRTNVDYASLLIEQGVYVLTLTDEAGNSCLYMVVIDKTEAYVQIKNESNTQIEVFTNGYRLYGHNIKYSVGTHKVIALDTIDEELGKILNMSVKRTITDYSFNGSKFFVARNNTNINNIYALFNEDGGKNYLTVKNEKVVAYDGKVIDEESSSAANSTSGSIIKGNEISITRKLYIVGANTKYSAFVTEPKDSKSYVEIEINTDNSRGMAYYSNTLIGIGNVPFDGQSSDSVVHMKVGNDYTNEYGQFVSGVNDAHATMDKYVGFVWLKGQGKFEVGKVDYQFYTLENAWQSDNKYFYKPNGDPVNIYQPGSQHKNLQESGDRMFFPFTTNYDGTTKEGLYEVIRYYKGDKDAVDYGNDQHEVHYYFIVDRNAIIDVTKEIGKHIAITMMEENAITGAGDFIKVADKEKDLYYEADGEKVQESFYVYLQTNKVPATLTVPTGKYTIIDGKHTYSSRGYISGQLNIAVYFQDIERVINTEIDNFETFKIFEKEVVDDADYFDIDFYKYLTTHNINLRDKLIVSSENGNWLNLKGRYVIIISDNTESSAGFVNKKVIGFEIIPEVHPEIEVFIGGIKDKSQMGEANVVQTENGKFEVTTNQEHIRVELPKYIDNYKMAQVDPEYIKISQQFGNAYNDEYIYYNYGNIKGQLIPDGESGIKYVELETFLYDKLSGKVLYENFNKPLIYTVTVRYKVGDKNDPEKYANCYYYNNDLNGENFYTSTYTIVIDRIAPTTNIEENLRATDALIQNGYIDTEFEAGFYKSSNTAYFTYQYADYYKNGKKLNDIYAFRVTEDTTFDPSDVAKLYYSSINDVKTLVLSLPVVTNYGTEVIDFYDFENYGNIFGTSYGFYTILELDKAGNVAQYVIHYSEEKAEYLSFEMDYTSVEADEETIKVGNPSAGYSQNIQVFDIKAGDAGDVINDYFFHISITGGEEDLSFVTNFATAYTGANSVANKIAKYINNKRGTYQVTIVPRSGETYQLTIGVYGESEDVSLNPKAVEVISNGKYFIKLDNANRLVDNVMYFAKSIEVIEKEDGKDAVTTTYYCDPNNGYNYYYLVGEAREFVINNTIECKDNTTYKVKLTDLFKKEYSPIRFNTAGKQFYVVEFANPGKYYLDELGNYYGFTQATIKYDQIFKLINNNITVKVNGEEISNNKEIYVENKNNVVTIKPIYDEETGVGGILEVTIQFFELDGTPDEKYVFIIDTQTQPLTLKDFTSGESKPLTHFANIDINDLENLKNYRPYESTSGIMNLSWVEDVKDYFTYQYNLYELMKDETIVSHDITSLSNLVIDTQSNSAGIYWFVITIRADKDIILGNKIYAFDVQHANNQLYYVKDESNLAINPNSNFKAAELTAGYEFYETNLSGSAANIDTLGLPSTNMPLYVTNQELTVVLTENVTEKHFVTSVGNGQTFTLYEINAITYNMYFGILKTNKTDGFVENVKVNETFVGDVELQTFVSELKDVTYTLTAERPDDDDDTDNHIDGLLTKNTLMLDVYYNQQLVDTFMFNNSDIEPYVTHSILGNGHYEFMFRDLAGNVHKFVNGTNKAGVMILREVVITVNDQNPVENAYYNGEVSLKVFASTKYKTGSIKVTATRNGQPIETNLASPYVFKDFGTYVVDIYAEFMDGEKAVPLTKTIKFIILNVKEARNAIDLTNLSQYSIKQVLNPNNVDVTSEFVTILNNKPSAWLLTYDDIMNNAEQLKVASGKTTFTILYRTKDAVYPSQDMSLQFTLNNEVPEIKCSLKPGETTDNGFKLTFNPGIIYEQIGDAYIMINGEIVYEINEDSASQIVKLSTTYKKDGDGAYYVQLVSSSGSVWQSFRVNIKEPLNVWAIVLIVVIVLVVGTVVTVFIVLRRKMRIR